MKLSRRLLLQGSAAAGAALGLKTAAGGGDLIGDASAQTADKAAVLIIFLTGGYNSLFSSADSFLTGNRFGVTSTNMRRIGTSNLYIDSSTLGTMPAPALTGMASVGIAHGISSHDPARVADFSNGSRSYPLMLASAIGGTAAIKAAVVGSQMPFGPAPAENGTSLQVINDMRATINALQGGTADPAIPNRAIARSGIQTAQTMAGPQFNANPNSLKMLKDGYSASVASLGTTTPGFDFNAMAQAYGIQPTDTTVGTAFTKQMLAAELMITAGTNVVVAMNGGWDSHGDTSGNAMRAKMSGTILPGLNRFLARMLPAAGRNVNVVIYGDFARSLPGSDHARGVTATVIGKRVNPGNTGRVTTGTNNNSGPNLPAGTPSTPGMYSLLATLTRAATNPFGANPHGGLVKP